jgi:hypothetical protein
MPGTAALACALRAGARGRSHTVKSRRMDAEATYTLIHGIDLLEAVRRYGRVVRDGAADDAATLPSPCTNGASGLLEGPILFLELEGGAYWLTVGGEHQETFHYCAVPDLP